VVGGEPIQDCAQDCIGFGKQLPVVEAQHGEACSFEHARSARIDQNCAFLEVLAAVKLDDEACLDACKVGEEDGNGVLAAELEAAELPVAQVAPKQAFGVGRGRA
jgi:hypothetical protein